VGPADLRQAVGEAGVHPRREPCSESPTLATLESLKNQQ
jgi:hypothetical protein